jgi:hypothetical protein
MIERGRAWRSLLRYRRAGGDRSPSLHIGAVIFLCFPPHRRVRLAAAADRSAGVSCLFVLTYLCWWHTSSRSWKPPSGRPGPGQPMLPAWRYRSLLRAADVRVASVVNRTFPGATNLRRLADGSAGEPPGDLDDNPGAIRTSSRIRALAPSRRTCPSLRGATNKPHRC